MKKVVFLILCSFIFIYRVDAQYVLPSEQNEYSSFHQMNDMIQIENGFIYVGRNDSSNSGVLLKYDNSGKQVSSTENSHEFLKVIELSDKKIVVLIERGFIIYNESFQVIKELDYVGPASADGIHLVQYYDIQEDSDGFLLVGKNYVKDNHNLKTLKENATLVKYDNSGNLVWEKESSNDFSSYHALDRDSSGNLYVVGTFKDSTKNSSGVLVKFNKNGSILYDKNYDVEVGSLFYDVVVHEDRITVLSQMQIPSGSGDYVVYSGASGVVQFNLVGEKLWSYVSTYGLYGVIPSSLVDLSDGKVFVVGNRSLPLSDKNLPMYFVISKNGEILEYQGYLENNELTETSLYYTTLINVNINGVQTVQLGGQKNGKAWTAFLKNDTNVSNPIFQNATLAVDKIEAPLEAKAGELVKLNFKDGTYKNDFIIRNYYTFDDITELVHYDSSTDTFIMPSYAVNLNYHYIEGSYLINNSIYVMEGSIEGPTFGKVGEVIQLEMDFDETKYEPIVKILNWNTREDVTLHVKYENGTFIMPDHMVDLVYEFKLKENANPSTDNGNDNTSSEEQEEEIENPKTGSIIPFAIYFLGFVGIIILIVLNKKKNYFKKL